MLSAIDVHFAYGDEPVIRGVSLEVGPCGLVGLLGPNGSGKTTLVRLLAGHLRPRAGRVTLDGRDVASMSRARLARRLAVVPQETHLAFDYTVLELVLMGRYPHLRPFELEGARDLAIAHSALAATRTEHLASRAFATLSGGEKQRVIIASALAQLDGASDGGRAGGILLLDEPTASLDLGAQLDVLALIERLWRERELAVVVSTHDLNLAAALCSEVVLLRQGAVVARGPTREVLTSERVGELYGIDVEVAVHPGTDWLTVVPRGRRGEGSRSPVGATR